MLFGAIWKGIIMGLGLSFSFGPVFFMLLQTSIRKGWKESLIFDAGVLLSDLIIILLAMTLILWLGIHIDFDNTKVQFWSAMIGAAILFAFGAILLFNPQKDTLPPDDPGLVEVSRLSHRGLFLRGLGINFLNPSVFLIWFGSVPAVVAGYNGDMKLTGVFFLSTLGSYFLIDLGKIYTARKLRRFLTPKALTLFHRISGAIFFGIGVWILYKFFVAG